VRWPLLVPRTTSTASCLYPLTDCQRLVESSSPSWDRFRGCCV
jgi:hypothetical protein